MRSELISKIMKRSRLANQRHVLELTQGEDASMNAAHCFTLFFIPFMSHGRLSGRILKCNLLLRERVLMARLHVIQRGGRSSIIPFTLRELQLG